MSDYETDNSEEILRIMPTEKQINELLEWHRKLSEQMDKIILLLGGKK